MAENYSREDEANLPEFKSYGEALAYFKEKHGKDFQFASGDFIDGQKIYFYHLIVDRETYERCMKEMENNGYSSGLDLIMSYQSVEIWEDGRIHMIH